MSGIVWSPVVFVNTYSNCVYYCRCNRYVSCIIIYFRYYYIPFVTRVSGINKMYFARVQHLPRRHIGSVFCARASENVFGTGEPSNRRLGNVPPGRRGQVDTQRGRSIVHAHLCWRCCNAHTCAPLGAKYILVVRIPFPTPSTPSHKRNRKSAYIVLYMPLKNSHVLVYLSTPRPLGNWHYY